MLPVALYAADGEVLSHSQRDFIHKAFPPPGPASAPNTIHLAQDYGRLPLSFEPNHGQMQEPVQFLSRNRDYTIFLTPTEAVLTLRSVNSETLEGKSKKGNREALGVRSKAPGIIPPTSSPPVVELVPAAIGRGEASNERKGSIGNNISSVIRMTFAGANQAPTVKGHDKLPGIVNYFIGNDPEQWRTNIPTYKKVHYDNLYEGIDLVYYGNQGKLEYDLVVAPGANPNQIQLAFEGADTVAVDSSTGDLVLRVVSEELGVRSKEQEGVGTDRETPSDPELTRLTPHASPLTSSHPSPFTSSQLRLLKPHVYQMVDGKKIEIAATYAPNFESPHALRLTPDAVAIHLAAYDTTKPLIIDPVLTFSTYLGGSGGENVTGSNSLFMHGIALDRGGNVFLTGTTASVSDFPTENPQQGTNAGGLDVFVSKIDPIGSSLVWSTYLGGSLDDIGRDITVDSFGQAHVTGQTVSTDFPTSNPAQGSNAGMADAFISKLSADGLSLIYSTYHGGVGDDDGVGIAVDPAGSAFIAGSGTFPVSTGAVADPSGAGIGVVAYDPTGSLLYSATVGGFSVENGADIDVDATGNAYVVGGTSSSGFPVCPSATGTAPCASIGIPLQDTIQGTRDGVVFKLNPTGTGLIYSTFLGGSVGPDPSEGGRDGGNSIGLDTDGNAYVTGTTLSSDFPTTPGAYQPIFGGGTREVFVIKLDPTGTALVYSTFLGGSSTDLGGSIALDSNRNAYVVGLTSSLDFPSINAVQPTLSAGSDGFLSKLDSTGSALQYSTFVGGSSLDTVNGVAVDRTGTVYLTGETRSGNFPTSNPLQSGFGGGTSDAFVAKVANTSDASAWGSNSLGQLGNGCVIGGDCANSSTPVSVGFGASDFLQAVVAGGAHAVGLAKDGTVWSWGNNGIGQLGDGCTLGVTCADRSIPVQVVDSADPSGFLTSVVHVAVADSHSLAVKANGTVWAWGGNFHGQLGDNCTVGVNCLDRSSPVQVQDPSDPSGFLTEVVSVAGGLSGQDAGFSLALKADGTVWAWGFNGFGELGTGCVTTNCTTPVQVAETSDPSGFLTGIVAIASGGNHSLALKANGTVWGWGDNSVAQLGSGCVTGICGNPVQIEDSADPGGFLTGVGALAAGPFHSLAAKEDGTVWGWGNNFQGNLGIGTSGGTSTSNPSQAIDPTDLPDQKLTGVVALASGGGHSLALKADGRVMAWGPNSSGQLGDGGSLPGSTNSTPNSVSNMANALAIAAGGSFSLALQTQGIGTADLTMQVDDNPDPVEINAPLDYTLTVTNNGPDDATFVRVFHSLPSGMAFDGPNSSPACTETSTEIITCDGGTIPNSTNKIFTIAALAPNEADILNATATATSNEIDANPGDDAETQRTIVQTANPQTDLILTITDTPDPVLVSENYTYTLTVNNPGPDVAIAAGVTIQMPVGVTLNSATFPGGSCTGSSTVTCDLGDLDVNTGTQIIVNVTATTAGNKTLTATADGTVPDPNPTNNTNIMETTTVNVVDKTWTGSVDTVWTTAANWSPAVVPQPGETVFIPNVANQPTLNTNPSLGGLTVETGATLTVGDFRTLTVAGTIDNSGTIEFIETSGFGSTLQINGDVTLTGGGTLTLNSTATNPTNGARMRGTAATDRLTNVNNTIQGTGQLGLNDMALTNQGTIVAAASGTGTELRIDPSPSGAINTGVLRANGGTLGLTGGTYTNTNGIIEALAGSIVKLSGATIVNGTLQTTLSGVVQQNEGGTTSTLEGVINAGAFVVPASRTTNLKGTITNSGTIAINAASGTFTTLGIDGDVHLTGGGTVTLSSPTNQAVVRGTVGGATDQLTNVDNTIQGTGQLGLNEITLTNQATIVVTPVGGGTDLTIDLLNSTIFSNEGVLRVDATSTLIFFDAFNQTAGSLVCNGGAITLPSVDLQGGNLTGVDPIVGSCITGNVINSGGVVSVGASAGKATIMGNYTQAAGGTLTMELGGLTPGTQHDQLVVTGTATLGGTLLVRLLPGFVPSVTNLFSILTYGSVVGDFATKDLLGGMMLLSATPLVTFYELEALRDPLTVTSTADSGAGSLREAITTANANAGTDLIAFNIGGGGQATITLGSALPTISDPVVIDGYTQPGSSLNTLTTGNNAVVNIELNGTNISPGSGLVITAGNSTVRGLVINRFDQMGITVSTVGNNVIEGNFIGTDPTGALDRGNTLNGVFITTGSTNNVIGGLTPGAANVISGNLIHGISVFGSGVTGNVIQGNRIGTNAAGTAALGNGLNGVLLDDVVGNTVGGPAPGARNIISGNGQDGVEIFDVGAIGNLVQGNFIGTDITGLLAVRNDANGVEIDGGASGNTIGGTVSGARNLISGNGDPLDGDLSVGNGVLLADSGTTGNVVMGNFIGTDVSGLLALGNTKTGVAIYSANGNTVGESVAGSGNLLSGNGTHGVDLAFGSTGNQVLGNVIGQNATGTDALGNGLAGVLVNFSANNNRIGGTLLGEANIITGNGNSGVKVDGSSTGILIQGNAIFGNTRLGIDLVGTGDPGNGVTLNDVDDSDAGPNNLQNFPVVTAAFTGSTGVQGTLTSTPNTQFILEFFSTPTCDASGHGEGETFLGRTAVTTNGTGIASFNSVFSPTAPVGHFLTSTATEFPGNNTSEFSQCLPVTNAGVVTHPLTVTTNGNGSGTVQTTVNGQPVTGIDCGGGQVDCTESYPRNTVVTLTATAPAGSIFQEWSGLGCTGVSGPNCPLSLGEATTITATFCPATGGCVFPPPVLDLDCRSLMAHSVTCSWRPPATLSAPLLGYNLYIGTEPGVFTRIEGVSPDRTFLTVNDLPPVPHFFAITTVIAASSPLQGAAVIEGEESGLLGADTANPSVSLAGWQIVDDGPVGGPSQWTGAENPRMKQFSRIGNTSPPVNLSQLGTHLFLVDGFPHGRTNYLITATLRSGADAGDPEGLIDADGALGVLFRYVDAQNYYRFSMDRQGGYRRLVKQQGGVFTLLCEESFLTGQATGNCGFFNPAPQEEAYQSGVEYTLELEANGPTFTLSLKDEVGLQLVNWTVTDEALAGSGFAHYTANNAFSALTLLFVDFLGDPPAGGVAVTTIGTGEGTVTSQPVGISVPGSPSATFAPGSTVTLHPSNNLIAWTGEADCSDGVVQVPTVANLVKVCTAEFGGVPPPSVTLDVDANGVAEAAFDGKLLVAYLFGLRGDALVQGHLGSNATRTTPSAMVAYLDAARTTMLDVDANNTLNPMTDGILMQRFMQGLRGAALITGVVDPNGARKTAAEIETFLTRYLPAAQQQGVTAASSLDTSVQGVDEGMASPVEQAATGGELTATETVAPIEPAVSADEPSPAATDFVEARQLVTVMATGDSTLMAQFPHRNVGAQPVLQVGGKQAHHAVVQFLMPDLRPDQIVSAELVLMPYQGRMKGTRRSPTHPLLEVVRLTEMFAEGNGQGGEGKNARGTGAGVTWACAVDANIRNAKADCVKPWVGGVSVVSKDSTKLPVTFEAGEQTYKADVTAWLRAALAQQAPHLSLGVLPTALEQILFYSKEGGRDNLLPSKRSPYLLIQTKEAR